MSAPVSGSGTATPVSPWNLANYLTVLRLALVPVFVLLLMAREGQDTQWRWGAAVVFLVAIWTDRIDGQIARSRGLITSFGKLADPIADKALTGAAFICLSLLGELPWLVTIAIMAREIGVTLLRFVVIRHGVMPASRGGKLKTTLQAIAIVMYVLPLSGVLAALATVVMGLAVVVTLVTGVDYVLQAVELRRTSERTALKRGRKIGGR